MLIHCVDIHIYNLTRMICKLKTCPKYLFNVNILHSTFDFPIRSKILKEPIYEKKFIIKFIITQNLSSHYRSSNVSSLNL